MRTETSRETPWTVLLADDPGLFVAAHGSFLTRAGARILTASSVGEAIEKTRAEAPDLVVLDADAWGVAALRGLRADPRTATVPVVLVAASPRKAEPGMVWLARPIDPQALARAVSRILGIDVRTAPRRHAALRATCFHGDRSIVAVTKDLGTGGLFLRTRERLAAGQDVQLIVDLPGSPKVAVRAAARVSRVVPAERDSHLVPGVGLHFERISQRDRAKVARFVETGETNG